jgi:hypothetical protein
MARSYPRKSDIARAMQAARNNGICIGAVELSPTGVIKIIDAKAAPVDDSSEFDRWNAAGKL